MKYPELGKKLQSARQAAGFTTVAAFATSLSEEGFSYTDDAIRLWEKGSRRPPRETLLGILALFVKHGVYRHQHELNDLLADAGMSPLKEVEQQKYLPHLSHDHPLNLPEKPAYRVLIGRDQTLKDLSQHLKSPGGKPVIVISGLGGMGKTALAYELVEELMVAGAFEKLLWETAKSEEFTGIASTARQQTINEHALLLNYAHQFGLHPEKGTSATQLEVILHGALRSVKTLVILDNMETLETTRNVAHILYRLVSPGQSRVLITSRRHLGEEAFVLNYPLKGLSEENSVELLQDEAVSRGADSLLEANKNLFKRIYLTTGGMPLAIKLIVSQYLLGIALDEALGRLERAVDEEELYRFIYEAIWEKLSLPAQQVMAGAAAFGVSAQHQMLMEVSEVALKDFDKAVSELIRMSLLEVQHHPEKVRQRYDLHAMTRWFVNAPLADMWRQQKRATSPSDPSI